MNSKKPARSEQQQIHSEASQPSALVAAAQIQMDWTELHRAVRLPEVLRVTGLSRSGWYALLNPRLPAYDSQAPRQFKLGSSSAWWLWEVISYLQAKSNVSRVH